MTELRGRRRLSAAPGGGVCAEPRNGERLTGLLHGLPGVHPQRVRRGPLHLLVLRPAGSRAETGCPRSASPSGARRGRRLATSTSGAHLPLRGLRRKRIYGTSEYPFSLQDGAHAVRYEPGECPNCEAPWTRCSPSPCTSPGARPSLGTSRPRLRKSVRTPAWRTFSSTDELDERTQRTMPRRFHRWTASSRRPSPRPPGPVVTRRGLLLLWTRTVASGGPLVGLARWGLGDPSTWPRAAPAPTGTATAAPSPPAPRAPFPTAGASPASTAVPTAAAPTATAAPVATATAHPGAGAAATARGRLPRRGASRVTWWTPWPTASPWRGFNAGDVQRRLGLPQVRGAGLRLDRRAGLQLRPPALDYRAWAPRDWMQLDQGVLGWIDDALLWAERYGSTSASTSTAPRVHRHPAPEAKSLWTDEEAQRACTTHWAHFAKRYAGHPNKRLSFNLFNEPPKIEPQVHGRWWGASWRRSAKRTANAW